MIYYVSRTGTKVNLAAIAAAGFRILVSRCGRWNNMGLRYCLDPGAWTDFQLGREFDGDAYERMLDRLGAGADFVILPDIVAGGRKSLDLSLRWSNRVRSVNDLALIPVQDGVEPEDMESLVGQHTGIFLGGSTEWKLARMVEWGHWCADRGVHFHAARLNTVRRIRRAIIAETTSGDGSSAARFRKTVPLLAGALAEQDLLSRRRVA